MFQSHYQVLRPLTSAHLAQTMTLLSLTTDELRQQIDAALASNPALELVEERRCPSCKRPLPQKGECPMCSRPKSLTSDEPIVFVSSREDFYTGGEASQEDFSENNFSPVVDDLPTFVLRQIAPELKLEDRAIAAYILTHLDEDGFLTISALEVARYHHIPLERVNRIIGLIQRSDPVGVGTSCPKEALLVQLEVLAESRPVPELARRAIELDLDLLSRHQYIEIAHRLRVSTRQIQETARYISDNLYPFPARSHWGDDRQASSPALQTYHHPDVIITFLNDRPDNPLVVEVIMPLHGTLRINPLFRQALHEASQEKINDWKDDLEKASLLVKCLQQRNQTMKRLMYSLVTLQKDFILHGETYLRPITRAHLSQELGVHESTISRAVSGKAIQLPNGRMIPLSKFFDRSLSVRSILKDIIDQENHPLSDTELVILLANQGIMIARRTVAKYRAMEGILPAHLRRSVAMVPA